MLFRSGRHLSGRSLTGGGATSERFGDLPDVPPRLQYGNYLPTTPVNDRPNALLMEEPPLTEAVDEDSDSCNVNGLEID